MSHDAEAPLLVLADALTARATDGEGPIVTLVAFTAGDVAFAVPIACCREVARVTSVARVPSALPLLRGLAQVRGRIVAVLDVTALVAAREAAIGPAARLLVIDAGGRTLAILCDDVEGIERAPRGAVRPVPEALAARAACLTGLVERAGRPRFVLDASALARTRTRSAP